MEYNELSSLVNGFDFNAIRHERNSRMIMAAGPNGRLSVANFSFISGGNGLGTVNGLTAI